MKSLYLLILPLLLAAGCGLSPTASAGRAVAPARATLVRAAAADPLDWPSRAPVGNIQLADPSYRSKANPDGWNDAFLANGDKLIESSYDRAVALGCQGVIFRDVEGRRFPAPTDYIAHPFTGLSAKVTKTRLRRWVKLAEDKGLWVGFTFRSTAYVKGAQVLTVSPAATIAAEINATRDYCGPNVKGVYWDSNCVDRWWSEGGEIVPLPAAAIAEVRRLVGPDVLLMPEFAGKGYDAIPGVYPIRWFAADGTLNPGKQTRSIVIPSHNPVTDKQRQDYVESMRGGAIAWVTATWPAIDTTWIPQAYQESLTPAN